MRAVLRVSPARRAARVALTPREAQAPHDVLDVDDRVVDNDTQRDHEARQYHRVDGGAGLEQDEGSGEQRQRNGDDADDCGAQFVKKDEYDSHDQADVPAASNHFRKCHRRECQRALDLSAFRGKPEVNGARSERRD